MASTGGGHKIGGQILVTLIVTLILAAGLIGGAMGFQLGYRSGSDDREDAFHIILEGYRDLIEEPTPSQVVIFMVVNGSAPVSGARVELERYLSKSDMPIIVQVKETNSLGIAVFQIREREWAFRYFGYTIIIPKGGSYTSYMEISSGYTVGDAEDWIYIEIDVGKEWIHIGAG